MKLEVSLQPKQREALNATQDHLYTFYGGARGGGKSHLLRAREVIRRLKYPNTRGLIIRKTYPELLANHIRPFFKEYPIVKEWFNKSEKTIYWPNGSTTEFSYLRATDDVYTYQGREYEDISIDEATQHEEEVFRTLVASLRTTNPEIKPSVLLTGNPGGIGHQWVKRLFVDRQFYDNEDPSDYAFIQAKVHDNQAIDQASYIKQLGNLPEALKKMWLEGDWNVFAGLAFTELQQRIHVIKPFELPSHAKYWAGFDWGYEHPFGFVLFATVDGKEVYVTKYLREQHLRPEQQAQKILETLNDKRIEMFCGTDIWNETGRSSIYEQLNQALKGQVTLHRAFTDREQGVAQIRKHIAWEGTTTGKPIIHFWENTLPVFNTVQSMQFNDKNPEDVLKVDADMYGYSGDDLYDAFRYGLMGYVRPNSLSNQPAKGTGQSIINSIQQRNRLQQSLKGWR